MSDIYADATGVLRWRDSGSEASFFGVNYVAPFAYTRRAIGYVAADIRKTIDDDLRHIRRLGLNAIRVHAWEVELSDNLGNLLHNDTLDLLDYLVDACQKSGIYVLLTPIRWGDNGYPEAAIPMGSFSENCPKEVMGTNPAAVAATVRFLSAFALHYKNESSVIALELLNEPWSPPGVVLKDYVNTLVKAVRDVGYKKPLFYNASEGTSPDRVVALGKSDIDGVTFGWYPTGLVSGKTLTSNFLPNVEEYPLLQDIAFGNKAKIIYEFDAADTTGSCLYAAMARTFRGLYVQWATQFTYCPLPLADTNTPYQTHFLNLVYAPRQAMGLMVAAEVFRNTLLGTTIPPYPKNMSFGPFRICSKPDLSEMVTETTFLHAGDTRSVPPAPDKLIRIAGHGTSSVVAYEGSGIFFLDRLAPGVWRLEVYPDSESVADPHAPPRLDRRVTRLLWRPWPMTITLPDLGADFTVLPQNKSNHHRPIAIAGEFIIRPGVYVLRRSGITTRVSIDPKFVVPQQTSERNVQINFQEPRHFVAQEENYLNVKVVAQETPKHVQLHIGSNKFPMTFGRGYHWEVNFAKDQLVIGNHDVVIDVDGKRYPCDVKTYLTKRRYAVSSGEEIKLPVPHSRYPEADALIVTARGQGSLRITFTNGNKPFATTEIKLSNRMRVYRIAISSLKPSSGWVMLRHPMSFSKSNLIVAAQENAEIQSIYFGRLQDKWTIRVYDKSPLLVDPERDFPVGVARGNDGYVYLDQGCLILRQDRRGQLDWRLDIDFMVTSQAFQVMFQQRSGGTGRLRITLLDDLGVAWSVPVSRSGIIPLGMFEASDVTAVPMPFPVLPDMYKVRPKTPRTEKPTSIVAIQLTFQSDGPSQIAIESIRQI